MLCGAVNDQIDEMATPFVTGSTSSTDLDQGYLATSGAAWFIREKGKCSSFSFETPWRWPGIDSIVDNGLRRKCIPRVCPNKK